MSMLVPAICQTPSCGEVWFATHLLAGPGNAIITRCTLRPCPKCGGVGDIPDGNYTEIDATFFQKSQFDQIAIAMLGLQRQISHGTTPAEIQSTIDKTPELHWLNGFIPKDWKDISEIITAFTKASVLITGLIAASRSGVLTGRIGIPSRLAKSLDEFVSTHPADQSVDHNKYNANTDSTNSNTETQKPTTPSSPSSPPKQ